MKGHLVTVAPPLARLRLPLTRDVALFLFVVLNVVIMGFETYLAHVLDGTIRFNEWIPIVGGPVIGVALLLALALARRAPRPARALAALALCSSAVIGILGTYFHFVRATRLAAAPGARVTLALLVWGAPLLAPLTFVLVAVLGCVTLSRDADGPGALGQPLLRQLPLSKDHAYFLLTCMGALIAAVSSIFDHLRGGFENPWLWVPTLTGIFAAVVAFILGVLPRPNRADLTVYTAAMIILLFVGPLGVVLHVLFDLGVGGAVIVERFLRGAPILAPMVFANMGLLGLLALFDPHTTSR